MRVKKTHTYIGLLFSGLALFSSPLLADTPLNDELTQTMKLEPNLDNGKKIFKQCLVCHQTNGWGVEDGTFPQIAGQHRSVIIKQVTDIRAGNRDSPIMYPIVKESVLGGPQAISDVAAYIESLPMTPTPGLGEGGDDARAEKLFYRKCAECHGADGSGDKKRFYPRIQGQHYEYLLRQVKRIKEGKRRNANPQMVKRIAKMKEKDLKLLVDYISRIKPPKDKLAEPDWKNPDFK